MEDIQLLVLHATEEPELADARSIAEASPDCIAAHFYIDRDGATEEWVPITRTARHASGHNQRSIGVELVNLGRYPTHFASTSQSPTEPFPAAQIDALEELIDVLRAVCVNLRSITRHSDLDHRRVPAVDRPGATVRRRIDPGPQLPWERLQHHFNRHR